MQLNMLNQSQSFFILLVIMVASVSCDRYKCLKRNVYSPRFMFCINQRIRLNLIFSLVFIGQFVVHATIVNCNTCERPYIEQLLTFLLHFIGRLSINVIARFLCILYLM